jgi:hypothetical protein
MKTILFTVLSLIAFNLNAQTEEKENTSVEVEAEVEPIDSTRFNVGETEVIIINHGDDKKDTLLVDDDDECIGCAEFAHWSGFEVGVNSMLNSAGGLTFAADKFLEIDPAESFNFAINFAQFELPFKTQHVGLVTGLGFEHSRFGFKSNYVIDYDENSTFGLMDTVKNFSKNQLRAWYFNIPVLLQFNTSKYHSNNVHIAVGGIGGVRMTSKTVQEYDIAGGDQKDVAKGKYNLNPFKVTATARVGYKNIGVFANYSLLSLFEDGTTETAYPLTFGISLSFN